MVGWPKIAEAEPILTRVLPVLRCGNAACAPSAIPVQFTEIWCSIAAGEISAMLPEVRTPALFTTTVIVLVGEWAAMGVIDGINVIGADDPTPVEE